MTLNRVKLSIEFLVVVVVCFFVGGGGGGFWVFLFCFVLLLLFFWGDSIILCEYVPSVYVATVLFPRRLEN